MFQSCFFWGFLAPLELEFGSSFPLSQWKSVIFGSKSHLVLLEAVD